MPMQTAHSASARVSTPLPHCNGKQMKRQIPRCRHIGSPGQSLRNGWAGFFLHATDPKGGWDLACRQMQGSRWREDEGWIDGVKASW